MVIERIFDAPREVVWKAWTDPAMMAEWWGPRGVTNPVCDIDVRPGGVIHVVMLAGKDLGELAGNEWPMKGNFQEIVPPDPSKPAAQARLVFTSDAVYDAHGEPQLMNLNTVILEEHDGKTKLTLHVVVVKAGVGTEGPLSGMKVGWSQSLDKLEGLLEARQ